jgi:predicted nucleic acid-binding Zn ribbon protein
VPFPRCPVCGLYLRPRTTEPICSGKCRNLADRKLNREVVGQRRDAAARGERITRPIY